MFSMFLTLSKFNLLSMKYLTYFRCLFFYTAPFENSNNPTSTLERPLIRDFIASINCIYHQHWLG